MSDDIIDASGLSKFGSKCSDARKAGEVVGFGLSLLDGESEGQLVKDLERLASDNRGALRIGPKAAIEELPILDRTGKVHGELPQPENFGNYSREDLEQLRDDLRQSVQERIEKNSTLGSDPGHAERQGAEQRLIQQLEKYLGDL